MSDYTKLIGGEEVGRAGQAMSSAAVDTVHPVMVKFEVRA